MLLRCLACALALGLLPACRGRAPLEAQHARTLPTGAAPAVGAAAPTELGSPVLRVHDVADLVEGDAAKMKRLHEKVAVFGRWPGGTVEPDGVRAIVVFAPPRVQELVEEILRQERQPLRVVVFDVRDLEAQHPGYLEELRLRLGDEQGWTLEPKGGALVAKASTQDLETIDAHLRELRTRR